MFTADTDYQSAYSTSNAGLAGEAVKKLKDLTANNGVIKTKSAGQTRQIASYKEDLKDLEKRLEKIHDRYINQFAVMDTMVDQMNSVRDSLKQQFEYKSNSR